MISTHFASRAALVLLGALVLSLPGAAQDTAQARRFPGQSLPPRVITSVPFNGMRYFIAITPVDTSNIDHMPIVGRRPDWPDVWIERNIPILPDSLLRRFPRREGPSK